MKMDLSGRWQVYMDAAKADEMPAVYPDEMDLPGTTSLAGLGVENPDAPEGYLTDAHAFEGYAWFRRSFSLDAPAPMAMLTLERTRMTRVWLDGAEIGGSRSLCTPHRFVIRHLGAGDHSLVVRVSNSGYPTRGGHMTSRDTQSNWNGITGEISLQIGQAMIRDVSVQPQADLASVRIAARVEGLEMGSACITVAGYGQMQAPVQGGKLDALFTFAQQPPLWSDLHPNLLQLTIAAADDVYSCSFGMRRMHTCGRKLLVNGEEVFLRGKHDGLVFPLTGHAPTTKAEWLRVMGMARAYGINHYRFHTCCPPEAAFDAADELGIYMEPELPFWGTVAAPGEAEYREEEQAYLLDQGFDILRQFGRHPSFVMFSLGNELWGSHARLDDMLAQLRAFMPDKLYVSGSNNFQFVPQIQQQEDIFVGVRLDKHRLFRGSYAMCDAPQGHVQLTEPESVHDYDEIIVPQNVQEKQLAGGKTLIQYGTGVKEVEAETAEALLPQIPVISHEVGQYTFYPDFHEIDRYTGPLKPRNLQAFANRLKERGLYNWHEKFFHSAGKLAVDCYRREIETALRSKELSGFQLLDLQDFPGQGTALVGVLNALMESKGLIEAEEWRRFCADTVVLGCFARFVLRSGESLRFGVKVSEADLHKVHTAVTCELLENGCVLLTRQLTVPAAGERLTDVGQVDFGVMKADAARQLQVCLTLEDGTTNSYPLWVLPEVQLEITREAIRVGDRALYFAASIQEARALQEKGQKAVVVPGSEGKLPAEYCSDFWCYPMFRSISEGMGKPWPVGTMGLCIEKEHPALRHFPTEDYTTPPWYRLLRHAHCEPIHAPDEVVVQMIDNLERCQQLGLVYKAEGMWHCTIRLWEIAHEPEAALLALGLMEYIA